MNILNIIRSWFDSSVSGIVSDFDAIVKRLEKHADRKNQESATHAVTIADLKQKQITATNESVQATTIAGNIKKLLGQ